MLVSTTENVAGHRTVETIGQVFGVVVRSRGLGGNIVAGLRSIVGGEIKEYTALIEDTRRHAIDRLVMNAQLMGADAVVMMRFDLGLDRPDDERGRRLRHRGQARTGMSPNARLAGFVLGALAVVGGVMLTAQADGGGIALLMSRRADPRQPDARTALRAAPRADEGAAFGVAADRRALHRRRDR